MIDMTKRYTYLMIDNENKTVLEMPVVAGSMSMGYDMHDTSSRDGSTSMIAGAKTTIIELVCVGDAVTKQGGIPKNIWICVHCGTENPLEFKPRSYLPKTHNTNCVNCGANK